MDEIKLYYEQNGRKIYVVDSISFKPVKAGKVTTLSLFAENKIKYPIDVEISIDDSDVQISVPKFTVKPNESYEIKIKIKPNVTRMNPIKAKFNVRGVYVIT